MRAAPGQGCGFATRSDHAPGYKGWPWPGDDAAGGGAAGVARATGESTRALAGGSGGESTGRASARGAGAEVSRGGYVVALVLVVSVARGLERSAHGADPATPCL